MRGDDVPDAEVEAKENKIVKENKDLSLSTLSLADFQLPLRPGHGISGIVIHLRTNYFKMTIDARKKLFKYSLTLTAKYNRPTSEGKARQPAVPPERSRKRRQALTLLFQHSDFHRVGHGVATDYGSTIITSKELPPGEDGTKDYMVVYGEIEDRYPATNPIIYTFTLKNSGLVLTTELLRYLASNPSDPSNLTAKDDAIQALNIIVARTPNFNPGVFQSGNNKFFHYPTDPNTYVDLGRGLIAVRGYYNVQTSPFYPTINVLELMRRHGLDDWLQVENFLRLLRVKTVYMRHEDGTKVVKVKTILGFSQQLDEVVDKKGKVVLDDKKKPVKRRNLEVRPLNSEHISFACEEFGNKTFTVQKYFQEKYNITLGTSHAWLLNCGTREKPVWISPELFEVMPGHAFRGKLLDNQTTQMIVVAARNPAENARRIANGAHEVIGFQGNPNLAAFGLGIDSKMILIEGRILPAPPVMYGPENTPTEITPTGASWNIVGRQLARPKKITKWSVLKLCWVTVTNEQIVESFTKALKSYGLWGEHPMYPGGFAKQK